jgi:tetratricopeptide (TPR) repeat protein
VDSNFKYKAFLSYSHRDQKWADWLHRELERYRVPPRLRHNLGDDHSIPTNLRPIFRDRDDLRSGASLPQVIHDALKDSEFLIVICSPSAVSSDWVNNEIRSFQKLGRGDRILCLIAAGEPNTGDKEECFPEALRNPVDVHGQLLSSQEEPIAADVRGGKHKKHAVFMLIAGLLEIDLDQLVQRDLHRGARKMMMIASGATLIAVIMAGLMVFAFLAGSEAEQRREDAQNLVGFMLGDLREDLHAIGRLDIYSSVSEMAMEYFRSLGQDDARDQVLAQRAEALRQIGSSRLDQGDMDGATEALNESLEISERLAVKDPSRLDWNLALAEGHFWVGYLHWQRGDLAAASGQFLEQLSVVDALAAAESDNPERLSQSGYAWTNYGRVLELSGQLEQARKAYETVMDIFEQVAVMQPDNEDVQLEIGFAHNNLGKLKIALGMIDEAEKHFEIDLEIKQQNADKKPSHNLRKEDLAVSHYWLGIILQSRGELDEATTQGERALKILDELLVADPAVTPWRQRRANVFTLLAANCRVQDDSECANRYIHQALDDLETLMAINPDNVGWRRAQCYAHLEAAWQAARFYDYDLAFELTDRVLRSLTALVERMPDDRETRKLEAMTKLTLADLSQKTSSEETARLYWQAALETLEAYFESTSDPEILDLEARLLLRLGQHDAALQITEGLESTKYHSVYPDLVLAQ